MFNQRFERELFDGEPWLLGQQPKLPPHLQSLIEQQQARQNIWEVRFVTSPNLRTGT